MDKKKLGLWAPVVVLAAALVMLALGTGEVEAGGRGKGGGKPPKGCTTCVLTVSPNPVPVGSTSIMIGGTGFPANQQVSVGVFGVCCNVPATTDASGTFSVTFVRNFDWPDTYTVEAFNSSGRLASTTFTVQ
jgi:hypothetical protein